MAIFEREYIVDITNVGNSNMLTNRGMLSILENVACKHSDVAGFGINDIENTHLTWVLLSWKVHIKKRVKYGTVLHVKTWARDTNKFQTYRDFEVTDNDGNQICIATTKWALINTEKNNIARITDDVINKYEPVNKHIFDNPEIDKITEPISHISEYIYVTQRRDIDVNNHMHNLNYLSVAYEALPEEVYSAPECNHIEIMYKKAIRLGDTAKCLYTSENNIHYITIKSLDEKTLHCIIKLY